MATMNRRPRRDATSAAAAKSIADFDKLGIAPPVTAPRRDAGSTAATMAEGKNFGLGGPDSTPQQVDADGVQGEGRERDYRAKAPKGPSDGAPPFRVKP